MLASWLSESASQSLPDAEALSELARSWFAATAELENLDCADPECAFALQRADSCCCRAQKLLRRDNQAESWFLLLDPASDPCLLFLAGMGPTTPAKYRFLFDLLPTLCAGPQVLGCLAALLTLSQEDPDLRAGQQEHDVVLLLELVADRRASWVCRDLAASLLATCLFQGNNVPPRLLKSAAGCVAELSRRARVPSGALALVAVCLTTGGHFGANLRVLHKALPVAVRVLSASLVWPAVDSAVWILASMSGTHPGRVLDAGGVEALLRTCARGPSPDTHGSALLALSLLCRLEEAARRVVGSGIVTSELLPVPGSWELIAELCLHSLGRRHVLAAGLLQRALDVWDDEPASELTVRRLAHEPNVAAELIRARVPLL
jgi:hypothetical protein